MSRSGYSDDMDDMPEFGRWRGVVASTIRGKRGQAFLQEMLIALDALPEKQLISWDFEQGGAVCAIASVGRARGIDMRGVDTEDYEEVAKLLDVSSPLAQEIMWYNDEGLANSPMDRFYMMRAWVVSKLKNPPLTPLHFWGE